MSRLVHAPTHLQAGKVIKHLLVDIPITKTVHRIVHGGKYTRPMLAMPETMSYLDSLTHLAPLHMPASLALVGLFSEHPAVLCFDTTFHQTIPHIAKTYAIPQHLTQKYNIKRFGFHGLAHESLTLQAAKMFKKDVNKLRIITCQLGNGASVCAIQNGISIDTSMGFTPLEGLVMGTRSGDIDPAIVPYLCEQEKISPAHALHILEKESGLLALGGASDVRDLLKRNDAAAKFALDVYTYRVRKYIGAYIAAMGGCDVIVLGGGVSRNASMRMKILSGLEELGVTLDKVRAQAPACISKGKIAVFVIEADEEDQMRKAAQLLG
jgi:acetate kinase